MTTPPDPQTGASAASHVSAGSADASDRSLSDLLSTLTAQLSTLFRKEVELAQTEIKQEIRKGAKAAGAMGAAGFAGYMAVLMLSFAVAWALGEILAVWLGFLIVGVIYGIVGAVLYSTGKRKLDQFDPKPEQTIETLKEDAEWAKARTR
jgi:hypothetical protein